MATTARQGRREAPVKPPLHKSGGLEIQGTWCLKHPQWPFRGSNNETNISGIRRICRNCSRGVLHLNGARCGAAEADARCASHPEPRRSEVVARRVASLRGRGRPPRRRHEEEDRIYGTAAPGSKLQGAA